jgi:two-component system sensor histidine kinase UhpB
VARDLHDDLGQDLAGAAMQLEIVARGTTASSPEEKRALERAQALIADATDRAYRVILSLRPAGLDDLGLAPAVRAHAERLFEGTGIRFELETGQLGQRLPAEMETAVFRILQEGLANIVRHGQARNVRLRMRIADRLFEGELADDGVGFDMGSLSAAPSGTGARGLGLLGMQERVSPWGGAVQVVSERGRGTRLVVRIPLPGSADGS